MSKFYAPLEAAHIWCNFPTHSPNDCKQYETQLTDDFINTCNTISVCNVNEYYTNLSECQPSVYNPQLVPKNYIHIEYDCLPSKLNSTVNI